MKLSALIKTVFRYIHYYLRAKNLHGIHSPFIYDLYESIISGDTHFYRFDLIESLRAKLLLSEKKIQTVDFGAGSKTLNTKTKKIADIARHYAKPPKQARILFRLVNKFQPQVILEFGTSLGISTLYLSSPNPSANVTTLEGCPETAREAERNFKLMKANNIRVRVGPFNQTLPGILEEVRQIDFLYIDGNHAYTPTLDYFHQCLKYSNENSVFVFDDIHWSDEMEKAWTEIKEHPSVRVTVDLFYFGIVFFKKELTKENFILQI